MHGIGGFHGDAADFPEFVLHGSGILSGIEGEFAEESDAAEIAADFVVQVAGDARAEFLGLLALTASAEGDAATSHDGTCHGESTRNEREPLIGSGPQLCGPAAQAGKFGVDHVNPSKGCQPVRVIADAIRWGDTVDEVGRAPARQGGFEG